LSNCVVEATRANNEEPYHKERIYRPEEVSKQAVVWFEPQPRVSEEARMKNVTGEVTLSVVLTSSGFVDEIYPVKWDIDEVNDYAIEAASEMWFSPALKDGRPVSQYATVTYHYGSR